MYVCRLDGWIDGKIDKIGFEDFIVGILSMFGLMGFWWLCWYLGIWMDILCILCNVEMMKISGMRY